MFCLSRFGTRNSQDVSKLEYQYEDYGDYEYDEDYYYVDDYENGFTEVISEDKQAPRTDTEVIVELTDRYVAPLAPLNRTANNSVQDRSSKSQPESHLGFTLQDFGIFPELRPPPAGDSLLPVEEMEEEKPLLSCPGGNIRDCVEGCVPLPLLWVYSVCVRECARRCP